MMLSKLLEPIEVTTQISGWHSSSNEYTNFWSLIPSGMVDTDLGWFYCRIFFQYICKYCFKINKINSWWCPSWFSAVLFLQNQIVGKILETPNRVTYLAKYFIQHTSITRSINITTSSQTGYYLPWFNISKWYQWKNSTWCQYDFTMISPTDIVTILCAY